MAALATTVHAEDSKDIVGDALIGKMMLRKPKERKNSLIPKKPYTKLQFLVRTHKSRHYK